MNVNGGPDSELGNLSQNGQISSPNDLRSSASTTTQSYAITAPGQRYQSYTQQVSVHSPGKSGHRPLHFQDCKQRKN